MLDQSKKALNELFNTLLETAWIVIKYQAARIKNWLLGFIQEIMGLRQ